MAQDNLVSRHIFNTSQRHLTKIPDDLNNTCDLDLDKPIEGLTNWK